MLMVGPVLAPGSPLRTTHILQVASSSPLTALLALFVSLVVFVLTFFCVRTRLLTSKTSKLVMEWRFDEENIPKKEK